MHGILFCGIGRRIAIALAIQNAVLKFSICIIMQNNYTVKFVTVRQSSSSKITLEQYIQIIANTSNLHVEI